MSTVGRYTKDKTLYAVLLIAGVVFQLSTLDCAFAQYVNSTAFCKSIRAYKCVGAFVDGQTVNMAELRRVSGWPAVYFFADVNAPSRMPIVVNMVRQGSCYSDGITPTDHNPGLLRTLWAYIQSGRAMDDLARIFNTTKINGELSAGASKGPATLDAKINPVIIPEANNFGTYSFRNVLCAGTILANVMHPDGDVIPGDNNVKKLVIVE